MCKSSSLDSSLKITVASRVVSFRCRGLSGCLNSLISEALRGISSFSESRLSLSDALTQIDLLPPDPDGCIFPISFISDRGLIVIDVPLLVFISIRIASNLFSNSPRILVILSVLFCSKISVQVWISLLTWLGSTSLGPKSTSPNFSCFCKLTLVKVSSPWLGVSTHISLVSLSGDGVSYLLDLRFLLFPILLKRKIGLKCRKSLNLFVIVVKTIRVKQGVIKETAFTVFWFTVSKQLSLIPGIYHMTHIRHPVFRIVTYDQLLLKAPKMHVISTNA